MYHFWNDNVLKIDNRLVIAGVKEEVDGSLREQQWGVLIMMRMHPDCIDVSIIDVILYYSL